MLTTTTTARATVLALIVAVLAVALAFVASPASAGDCAKIKDKAEKALCKAGGYTVTRTSQVPTFTTFNMAMSCNNGPTEQLAFDGATFTALDGGPAIAPVPTVTVVEKTTPASWIFQVANDTNNTYVVTLHGTCTPPPTP